MSHPKEHGMPFSARLVAAIVQRLKTETRRIIGWHNSHCASAGVRRDLIWNGEGWPDISYHPIGMVKIPGPDETAHRTWCRYEPGDRIWVRETYWRSPDGSEWDYAEAMAPDSTGLPGGWKKVPSIHMPRDHSRILLGVESVDGERIQDISPMAIIREGAIGVQEAKAYSENSLRDMFRQLWNGTNAHREGASWEDNPLVWAIRFKILEAP